MKEYIKAKYMQCYDGEHSQVIEQQEAKFNQN